MLKQQKKSFDLYFKEQTKFKLLPSFLRHQQTLGSYTTRKNIHTVTCIHAIQQRLTTKLCSGCMFTVAWNTWVLNNATRNMTFLITFTYPRKIPILKGLCGLYQVTVWICTTQFSCLLLSTGISLKFSFYFFIKLIALTCTTYIVSINYIGRDRHSWLPTI